MARRVTCGILTYKSPAWLGFVLEGIGRARNEHTYAEPFVLALDPYPEIEADPRVTQIFRSANPDEHYLRRVYRAWNRIVECVTDVRKDEPVVLLNTDMYPHHGWLDALVQLWGEHDHAVTATSLLVESGRIPSAFPDIVQNLGITPRTFDRAEWEVYATSLIEAMNESEMASMFGGLYMPVLLTREMWEASGGYPIGNVAETPGDHVFFSYLDAAGYPHFTAPRSLVYHVQVGEMEIDAD